MGFQHVSTHHGEDVLWYERDGVFAAIHVGHHILIERAIPVPIAITADRVVIGMSPRRFRCFVDGIQTDPECEFFVTLEQAKDAAVGLVSKTLVPLVNARRDREALLGEKPVSYEDWA